MSTRLAKSSFSKKLLVFCALLLFCSVVSAQNLAYTQRLVDTLTSEEYHGRGYVNNGGKKAANFIKEEFLKAGLSEVRFQNFEQKVNTFPGKLSVSISGRQMKAGIDYLVMPYSGGGKQEDLKAIHLKEKHVKSLKRFQKFVKKNDWSKSALFIDKELFPLIAHKEIGAALQQNPFGAKAIVHITNDKLTWSVRDYAYDFVCLEIKSSALPKKVKQISFEVEQELKEDFANQNVIGYVRGSSQPDSFVVYTAHYDHLGRMGSKACFYGANDNAGGAAMLCDLANYYTQPENHPQYSVMFIAFGAEEAGLKGSKYYVENPDFPLEKISLLINLDLITTGQDGITVVNGRIFKGVLGTLRSLNEKHDLMKKVGARGKAANSDHYWFSEEGVRAIFIYLLGDYPHYHDVHDTADKPTWAGYESFFKLITLTAATTWN